MTKRQHYAKFQVDNRPKKLPHAGHPDWEEWEPPQRVRHRDINEYELLVTQVIRNAFEETSGIYPPEIREEAYRWIMHEDEGAPWTFSWCCTVLNLNMETMVSDWQRNVRAICMPTEGDRRMWVWRGGNMRRKRLTDGETDRTLSGEQEG